MSYEWFWDLGVMTTAVVILAVLQMVVGVLKYRDYLNPLSAFGFFNFGCIIGLSAIVSWMTAGTVDVSHRSIIVVLAISLVYGTAIMVPHLVRFRVGEAVAASFLRTLAGKWWPCSRHLPAAILACGLISFVLMAYFGGGGLRWVTNPRDVYITNRAGVGLLWAAYQWMVMIAFIFWLWDRRPSSSVSIIGLIVYVVLLYFSGSKGMVLLGLFAWLAYIQYVGSGLGWLRLSGVAGSMAIGFISLLAFHGSAGELNGWIYYFDYLNMTALAFDRTDILAEYGLGRGMISDLWKYIPRAIWPDKPYEYGVCLIHRELFPGMAETGNTPGVAPWLLSYYDYGLIGVVVEGLCIGVIQRAGYRVFLDNKENPIAFLVFSQFAWVALLYSAFPLIAMIVILSLRLRILSVPTLPRCRK
jgi:hypothetical protein